MHHFATSSEVLQLQRPFPQAATALQFNCLNQSLRVLPSDALVFKIGAGDGCPGTHACRNPQIPQLQISVPCPSHTRRLCPRGVGFGSTHHSADMPFVDLTATTFDDLA